jgi:hypothetical protein
MRPISCEEQFARNGGSIMVARERVQGGVVVLADGVHLPEGLEVTVLVSGQPLQKAETHSVLHIPAVSLGSVLRPLTRDDDLLGEMVQDRS